MGSYSISKKKQKQISIYLEIESSGKGDDYPIRGLAKHFSWKDIIFHENRDFTILKYNFTQTFNVIVFEK